VVCWPRWRPLMGIGDGRSDDCHHVVHYRHVRQQLAPSIIMRNDPTDKYRHVTSLALDSKYLHFRAGSSIIEHMFYIDKDEE
jgi:hypothetical protein